MIPDAVFAAIRAVADEAPHIDLSDATAIVGPAGAGLGIIVYGTKDYHTEDYGTLDYACQRCRGRFRAHRHGP